MEETVTSSHANNIPAGTSAMIWPGCMIQVAPLLFFDLETTGLRPDRGARITEIAVLDHRHVRHAWEATSEEPDQQPLAAQLPGVLRLLRTGVVVGHNVPFDFGFLAYASERLGYEGPRVWYIDTLALARRLLLTVRDYRLDTLLTHYDLLPEAPLHTALTDARATRRLFWKLVNDGDLETLADAEVQRLDWQTF